MAPFAIVSARIAAETFELLSNRARRLSRLQEPLTGRPDLPPEIAQKLYVWVSGALKTALAARYPDDDEALRMLYLRTLARKPTDREAAVAKAHLKEVGKRNDAFEDLLWALLNSTEFQTKK